MIHFEIFLNEEDRPKHLKYKWHKDLLIARWWSSLEDIMSAKVVRKDMETLEIFSEQFTKTKILIPQLRLIQSTQTQQHNKNSIGKPLS